MKPIAALLTDLHLSDSNWETIVDVFSQTTSFCEDNQIKTIICIGDVFHSRKAQTQFLLTVFERILDDLQQKQLKMISIVGNHDKTDYRSKDSFLSPFKHHPALTLIEESHSMYIDTLSVDFLSYFDDDVYLEYLKELHSQAKDRILFTHIGVSGARMNNSTIIESPITPKAFSQYKAVYVGHYHDSQHVGKNIHYIGATIQHNYGESSSKGVQVLYDDGSIELFELDFPKYITYQVAVKDLTNKDLEDLKQEKLSGNDFIRIQLLGEEKDLKSYDIQGLKQIGVDVQMKMEEIAIRELEVRIEPFDPTTLKEQFAAFCKENELDLAQGMEYFKTIEQNV